MSGLRGLRYLLQFDGILDTLRYYLYKYAENKVMAWVYAVGCIVVIVCIYGFMARGNRRR